MSDEQRLAQHTPGPWIADSLFMKDDQAVRVSAYDGTPDYYHRCMSIAECHVRDNRHDKDSPHVLQAEANARLIAAAPDLLEALKLLYREMELSGNARSKDYGWLPAITKSREAIAKAEGASRDNEEQFTEHLSDERLYELMALLEWQSPIRADLNSARDAIRELIFHRRSGARPLTKRERFAAMAMQGSFAYYGHANGNDERSHVAELCVKQADALLAALKEAPMKPASCIHRAGCPKPDVCGEVGHCTSQTREGLETEKALTSKQMSPQLAGLVNRLQEWSRNCLIDGLKMDKGEPSLQDLLREAYLTLMRASDETPAERDELLDEIRQCHRLLKRPNGCTCRYCSPPKTSGDSHE